MSGGLAAGARGWMQTALTPDPSLWRNPETLFGHFGRLLLVEDHADSAEALAALLDLAGCDVTVAGSVQEALAAATAAHRLLISDLALPDGSDRELLGKLREQGRELDAIVLLRLRHRRGRAAQPRRRLPRAPDEAGRRRGADGRRAAPCAAGELTANPVRRLAPHGD
jgi:CheY-like chemotaxis protein